MTGPLDEEKQVYSISLNKAVAKRLESAGARAAMAPEAVIERALEQHLKREAPGAAVYLSSPASAMMKGIYKETATIGEVKLHGDFGLGTFNELDGEMVLLDGVAYQIRTDGQTCEVSDDVQTPFACATFFDPVSVETIDWELDNQDFKALLERIIPSENMFYGIRIDGTFNQIKMWSVPKQPDHRPITEVRPSMFTFSDVYGTLAGFYTPEFIKALSMPGFHFHFLTADRRFGGHLKECNLKNLRISVQFISRLELDLPSTFDFMTTDLV
ncbi:MAG: acetolactate decarboxylase [Syntrophobacteraceae bacterium]